MNDILLAHSNVTMLQHAFEQLQKSLQTFGLVIADDKIQKTSPFAYLGKFINATQIIPQKIEIRTDQLHTLNDVQKLLGDINWLRPSLKLTTAQLQPLFDILKGDSNLLSPRTLTSQGAKALQLVNAAIQQAQLTHIHLDLPVKLIICPTPHVPMGVLWQPVGILEWLHMKVTPSKVITPYYELTASLVQMGRTRCMQLFGYDPTHIILPYNSEHFTWLLQHSNLWGLAFCGYSGPIDNHYPSDKLIQFSLTTPYILPTIIKHFPLPNAFTVLTDGSSNGIAAIITDTGIQIKERTNLRSAQQVELHAIMAFQKFSTVSFNLYSDSRYLVEVLVTLETATLGHTNDAQLFHTFMTLQHLIRTH